MRKLMMAQSCADFIACTPYFKDGFSFQTGIGGAAIATAHYLADKMREYNIHMGFGAGGMSKPMCDLLEEGLVNCLLDTQNFDLPSIDSLISNPKHFSITTKEYADPFCKGAVVNKLDFVILGTLEADINFNCNVVVSSEGKLMGAQGGHPDTAAGAKCTIVITPLLQGRIPAVRNQVTTVTTPGETVDVIVTDYGIAINPKRTDLLEAVKDSHISLKTIEELRDIAYGMAGEPEPLEYEDRVVAVIESRDGTIMDVVRKRKDKTPN
jgi:citrate (pro-3S)-lyase